MVAHTTCTRSLMKSSCASSLEGGGEAGVVDGGADTLLLEHLRHGFRLAPAHAIDDAAFSGMAGYEVKNCLGFFLLLVAPFYGEAQVGTVER